MIHLTHEQKRTITELLDTLRDALTTQYGSDRVVLECEVYPCELSLKVQTPDRDTIFTRYSYPSFVKLLKSLLQTILETK